MAWKRLGLTYRELSLRMDCTEKTAHSLCHGKTTPDANQLAALADALELSLDELFKKERGR